MAFLNGRELAWAVCQTRCQGDGPGPRAEPSADDRLEDEDGLLVFPAADSPVTDDLVQALREAGQASPPANARV